MEWYKSTHRILSSKRRHERYNIMIDGENFADYSVKDGLRTNENNSRIATGHRDDYSNGCLLNHNYFKENYKLLAKDSSNQRALGVDSKSHITNWFY